MSFLSAFSLGNWRRPKNLLDHIYTVVDSNSEVDIEEEKSIAKGAWGDFGTISRRKKWSFVGLVTALWFITAAILSLIVSAFPKLYYKSDTSTSAEWFPNGQ